MKHVRLRKRKFLAIQGASCFLGLAFLTTTSDTGGAVHVVADHVNLRYVGKRPWTVFDGHGSCFAFGMVVPLGRKLPKCYQGTHSRSNEDGIRDKYKAAFQRLMLETRRVSLVGFTPYPDQDWMEQLAADGCSRCCSGGS